MKLVNFFIFYFLTIIMISSLMINILKLNVSRTKLVLAICLFTLMFYYYRFYLSPPFLSVLLAVLTEFILLKGFFRFDYIYSFLILLISVSIYIPLESIDFALSHLVLHTHYNNIFNSFIKTAVVTLFSLTLLLIIYKLTKYYNLSLKVNISQYLDESRKNRKTFWMVLIITLENIFLIYDFDFRFILSLQEDGHELFLLFFALIIFSIMSFIIIHLFKGINKEVDFNITQEKVDYLSKLNYTLQRQQHDFKQHLQLLMALIQMNKYDKAQEYMKSITDQINGSSTLFKSGIPALNGLLNYKAALAKRHKIKLKTEISTKLENLPGSIDDIKICRTVGNLLDNAIEYLDDKVNLARYIELKIQDTEKNYLILVSNPVQDKAIFHKGIEEIFEPGYTSKGEGHGFGLSNVKIIINEAGGRIDAEFNRKKMNLTLKLIIPKAD